MPGGGIERLRSFTITFSHVSAEFDTCTASAASNMRFAVLSFWLWQVTQYLLTSARAGVVGGAGAWNPDAVKQIAPNINTRIVKISLRTAFVLGLARMAELRIGAVLKEQIRAFLVV